MLKATLVDQTRAKIFFVASSSFITLKSVLLVIFCMMVLKPINAQNDYGVGFERIVVLDSNRVNVHSDDSLPRPVIINMWYPTDQTEGNRIPYERYMTFQEEGINPYLAKSLEKYNNKMTRHYLFESRINHFRFKQKKVYKRFKKSTGLAIEKAVPASGKFPLIVYHQGAGAPIADNQKNCEYLASKGFVVCNAAYQYNMKKWPGVGWDPKVSIPDMDVLIDEVGKRPFVNTQKLGLIGHSIGGDVGLAYLSQGKYKVSTLITLDAHFGYCMDYVGRGNVTELLNMMWANLDDYNVPMLNTASYAFFPVLDSLVYSPRTYLEVGQIGHEDFTSNRIEGRLLLKSKNKMNDHEKQVLLNHDNLRKCILANFNYYLKGEQVNTEHPFGSLNEELDLPKDQFIITNLQKGENPFSTTPQYIHSDSSALKKFEGVYEANVDGRTYRCKVFVKDGELKRIGVGKNQDYFWDANEKIHEHPIYFRTPTNYYFHTYVWGHWLLNDEGNVTGFITKWFNRQGTVTEAVNVKIE